VVGAFQCPTVLNNVETYCAVPPIILGGGKAFADLGVPKAGGTKLTCLTGHINNPGVYELTLGFPVMKMINDVGGGMRNGKKLKAFIPGGSSCPVLTGAECEGATMDYDSMAARKSMLGSGGVVVMDEDTCMVKAALRIMRFYAHESCGWCIPCREGTAWLRKLLTRVHEGGGTRADIDLIGDVSRNMLGRTFCPLGDAASLPTTSIVEKFRQEFEDHLNGRPCPFESSRHMVSV
jgi:NADH-quinone oxidoreductase subunit F